MTLQHYQAKFLQSVQDIISLDTNITMKGTVWRVMVSEKVLFNVIFSYFLFPVSVFIYSMPGYSVSIKERMLYSSCKNSVVDVLERVYSIPVDKKVEVDSGEELTVEFLMVTYIFKSHIYVHIYHYFTFRESCILSKICINQSFPNQPPLVGAQED